MKICLGTVQQGMDYGIYGGKRPDKAESIALFELALNLGIDCFDTAAQYGDAETLIGEFIAQKPENKEKVKVISKLSPNALDNETDMNYNKTLIYEARKTIGKLGLERLHGFLLHNPDHIFDERILIAMNITKLSGLTENVGVSVYTPQQALAAAEAPLIDYIQIPYNVLDRRLDKTEFFKLAKGNGKVIFARSTFLQGLLLMDLDSIVEKLPVALPYVKRFRELAEGISLYEACIAWSRANSAIDYLVLGVTGKQDLKRNVKAFSGETDYSSFIEKARQEFSDVPETVVRPDLWDTNR